MIPLLLCEANLNNMRIIVENGHPVSNANYYSASIAVEGTTIRVASFGAVCTHPDYRVRKATHIYHQEAVRYHRTFHEFIQFHKGATTPWGNMHFKSYLINVSGKAAAYIIVQKHNLKIREKYVDQSDLIFLLKLERVTGFYRNIQGNIRRGVIGN